MVVAIMMIVMRIVMRIVMMIMIMIKMMMEIIKGKRWKDNLVRRRRACLRQTEKAKVLQQGSELFMQSWRR